MASIKTEDITLGYTCPECETEASQPLSDTVSVGTLVCNNCDTEMELDTTHDVVLSSPEESDWADDASDYGSCEVVHVELTGFDESNTVVFHSDLTLTGSQASNMFKGI